MRGAGLRSRWPHWPVTFTVVGFTIVGGSAAVAKWPHAWWWLIVVTAIAAAVMPPALQALSHASQRRQEIGQAARAGLQGTTGATGGKLPTARTAHLEARVHQAVLPIPYIHRDEEEAIRSHLRARRPVLLIGSSMVGKTKMAARVIAEEFGSLPVAIPDSKTALADLDAKNVTLQDSVIWLDDIDRLIGTDGITDGALRRLAASQNVIMGTIRARAYDQLQPSDQLRLPEWDVLCVFEHVFIRRDLSEKEQEQLARTVTDLDIQNRIRTVGLGEYIGAARQVAEALKLGAAGTDRLGYALVLAAADWRRCGMARPIPAVALAPMARPHLDNRGQARLADQNAFNTGLSWATRDINPNVALLQPAGTDSYVIYDYALDLISAQGGQISDSSWAVIMAAAEAPELVRLGYTAKATYDRTEIATQAWRKAANSGHAEAAPRAAVSLGMLLAGQGEVQEAKKAYQKAIDSKHANAAPLAAYGLGMLLAGRGEVQEAKEAYQKAIDSGHADAAPMAAEGLGGLLAGQGEVQEAKKAYQKAIDSEHANAAPLAAYGLGMLLADQGEVQEAKEAYQKAIDSEHADAAPAAPLAAHSLGGLLADQGEVQEAKEAYQKAIDSGHANAAPLAAYGLGMLLADQGEVQEAKEAYQKGIDSEHANAAPLAAVGLGMLLAGPGEVQEAKEAYQKAIDSEHANAAPLAAARLGGLLADQGEVQEAKEAYQKAIDSGHADAAPLAAVGLGLLLTGQGLAGQEEMQQKEMQEAKEIIHKAIDSGHADAAPLAAYGLGMLLEGQGDVRGAKEAYQKAIDSEHANAAPLAAARFAELLKDPETRQASRRPDIQEPS